MLQRGRVLFSMLGTGLVATPALTMERLPPVVASHFDAAGVPNGWSSRPVYALVRLGVGILLPLATVGLIVHLIRHGAANLNIPRSRVLAPPGAQRGSRRTDASLSLVALRHRGGHLVAAIILVTVTISGWAIGWYRLLRPPLPCTRSSPRGYDSVGWGPSPCRSGGFHLADRRINDGCKQS